MMTEIQNETGWRHRSEWIFWLVSGLLTLAFFFRTTILSGFDLGIGDRGDARLMMFLMEHWWLVVTGEGPWNQPLYFAGAEGLLATTDTFLMHSLIYVPLRAIGLDLFGAWQGVWFSWAVIGFGGMGWLLRRELRLPAGWSIAGSVLFIVANPTYLIQWASHLQLLSIWLVPWLVVFGIRLFQNWENGGRRWYGWGAAFAGLYGLMALSTFYVVWMATFYGCLAAVVWYLGRLLSGRLSARKWQLAASIGLEPPPPVWRLLRDRRTWLLGAILLAGLLPFFALYLPLRLGGGGWSYTAAYDLLPVPRSWFNPGQANWFHGWYLDDPTGARIYGHTPVMWGVILFLSLYAIFSRGAGTAWVRIVVVTNLLLMLLLTRFGDFSAWRLVFELVPGADVIRAPFRICHVLYATFPALLAWAGARIGKRGTGGAITAGIVCGFILLEQVNTQTVAKQSRSEWEAYVAQVPVPPDDAVAFGLLPENPTREAPYLAQSRAMLLAAELRLPTLNGLTGRFPDGYSHYDTHKPSYATAVESWAFRYQLTDGCYWYDEAQAAWKPFGGLEFGGWEGIEGTNLLEHPARPWIFLEGFSFPESWGIWSEGPQSRIILPAVDFPTVLEIEWSAYLPEGSDPLRVRLRLDGKRLGDWHFPGTPDRVRIPVPAVTDESLRFHTLELDYHEPRRPVDYSASSGDMRRLAIGFRSLKMERREAP